MIDDKSHYNLFEWYPTKWWRNQRVFYPWKSHVHLFQPVWLAFPASCLKLISSLSWSKTQSCWPTKNALPQMGCSSCVPGNSTLKLSWTVGKHGKMKEDDGFLDHWIGDFVGHPILGPKWKNFVSTSNSSDNSGLIWVVPDNCGWATAPESTQPISCFHGSILVLCPLLIGN